jgi:hypothetical protein
VTLWILIKFYQHNTRRYIPEWSNLHFLFCSVNNFISCHPPFSSLYSGLLNRPGLSSASQSQIQSHIATDGQSVSLGVEPPSGAHDQIFIAVWQLQFCCCGASSLTRGRVCLLSESLSALDYLQPKVKVKITLQLTVSQSVILGVEPQQIFITVWQLRSCFCGAPSLTRGRVCLFYMLLALASAVFLGSESLVTRDHILLSQIWDFPFRRLLRLAGSWWRYSTPPSHG